MHILTCADLQNDPNNCGACFNHCNGEFSSPPSTGKVCVNGKCQCPSGEIECSSAIEGQFCINLNTDSFHCGSCTNDCTQPPNPSGSTCQSGTCQCPTGQPQCGGGCADLSSDIDNCGACGNVCPIGGTYTNGVCT